MSELINIRFDITDKPNATVEKVLSEVAQLYLAVKAGKCENLNFNDSNKAKD